MDIPTDHPVALAVVVCMTLPLELALLFAPLRMLRLMLRAGINVNGVTTSLDPVERREMQRELDHEPHLFSFAGRYKRVVGALYFYMLVLLLIAGCGLLSFLIP